MIDTREKINDLIKEFNAVNETISSEHHEYYTRLNNDPTYDKEKLFNIKKKMQIVIDILKDLKTYKLLYFK